MRAVRFDVVIIHTLFTGKHWSGREAFRALIERASLVAEMDAVKVMLPQDEFYCSELYCELIERLGVDIVFSVAPESEWRSIYRDVDFDRVRFVRMLTGYLDEKKIDRLERAGILDGERPVDVCYRASGRPVMWFGRHGWMKHEIAAIFSDKARERGLVTDIALATGAAIVGDRWYRFLASSKYTIGTEGGTSLIDFDGSIRACTEAYVAAHPDADFGEVERACFPGLDGSARLFALSPRHLEACASRTCQLLVEGEYNGVLEPGKHYIEIKADYSNLDEVLDLVATDSQRSEIVERAHRDVVASGRYTYRRMVELITETAMEGRRAAAGSPRRAVLHGAIWALSSGLEAAEWSLLVLLQRVVRPLLAWRPGRRSPG